MLEHNVEYSHRLAAPAKIPVYLQVLLLLLSWLSLHLPTGAYKPRTSHARAPANTIPTGRFQCKLFVYSCSLSIFHKHTHMHTHEYTHTKPPGFTGTHKYSSVHFRCHSGLTSQQALLVKINYMPKGHSFSLTISVSMVTPFDSVRSPGVMLLTTMMPSHPDVECLLLLILKIMLLALTEWPS